MDRLARQVGARLQHHGLMLCTAESCTGGWLAKVVTDISGSSAWFERGFVTYSNVAKQDMLGVSPRVLERHGAVSEQTARAMVEGACNYSAAQVGVAVTGIAGPAGGTATTPVGTVWLAWARLGQPTRARHERFSGDRQAIRRQAVVTALQGLLELIP